MTNFISIGPNPTVSAFQPLGYGLPYANGLALMHAFNTANISGTSVKNLAYQGAPASTMVGSTVSDGNTLAFNPIATGDSLVSAITDTASNDVTIYVAALNTDTLAGNSTQPIFASTFAGSKGISVSINSSTQARGVDYGLVSAANTANQELLTVTNISTAWKLYAFTTTLNGTNLISTIYNLTDGTSTANTLANVTARSVPTAFFHFGSRGDISNTAGGKCKIAFTAIATSAFGQGGLHTLAQMNANAIAIRSLLSTLPSPVVV